MRLKILGIFKSLPLESMSCKSICGYTSESEDIIKPILDLLLKEGHIKGKRSFKLHGKHLETFNKYHKGSAIK